MITIRPWEEEDAFALRSLSMHAYFSKQRLLKYFYPDSFLNAISTIYFYQNADPNRFLFRAIVKDEQVIGYISAQVKNERSCELSYWLGVEFWNQGYMSEAVKQMCKEAFERLSVVCVYALVDHKNIASQKVLEKCRFQKECVEHLVVYRYYK